MNSEAAAEITDSKWQVLGVGTSFSFLCASLSLCHPLPCYCYPCCAFIKLISELSRRKREAATEEKHNVDKDLDRVSCVSLPENQAMLFTVDTDNCGELNLELQRALMGLESAVCGHRRGSCGLAAAEADRYPEQTNTDSQSGDLNITTVEEAEGPLGFFPSVFEERLCWEKELAGLQEDNGSLTVMLSSNDEAHGRAKAAMNALRQERDHLCRQVRELQTRIQSGAAQLTSECVSSAGRAVNPSTRERGNSGSSDDVPLAEVSPHTPQDLSNTRQIFRTLHSHAKDDDFWDFQVETERLNSRIEHLKSQNDLLTITLAECKGSAERMSVLMGKHESNATALHLALRYSEQCIAAYELLLAVTGRGPVVDPNGADGVGTVGFEDRVAQTLAQANDCMKTAEPAAKEWTVRLGGELLTGCGVQPWESLSSKSRSSTFSSVARSCDADVSKEDEQQLKDYIAQLKSEREAVKRTMLQLESADLDTKPRSDLENAVLMQELMAMKEETAEIKAQLYLLEKQKAAVELQLGTREALEQAHLVQLEHLKAEVEERREQRRPSLTCAGSGTKDKASDSSVIKLSEMTSISDGDPAAELTNALQKEMKLKVGVNDMLVALEKLTRCCEIRNQHSTEFVSELKQANSNLVAAYEKAKRKHQNKLRKLESQMVAMVETHEAQVRVLRRRIGLVETSHFPTNATCL